MEKFAYVDGVLWNKRELTLYNQMEARGSQLHKNGAGEGEEAKVNFQLMKDLIKAVLRDRARRRHIKPTTKRRHHRAKRAM